MTVYAIASHKPQIDESAYIAPTAVVIGRVSLAAGASVWFNAVLRGDNEPIDIGEQSNVQEGAVLHVDPGFPIHIGRGVTVGHQAMLHGCTIGDGTLVGIQAVVLNGARIGRNCIVGAGALVTEGKVFPDNTLIVGAPAKAVRELTSEDIAKLAGNAQDYAERAMLYRRELHKVE